MAESKTPEEAISASPLTPKLIEEAAALPPMAITDAKVDAEAAERLPHAELGRDEALQLLTSVFAGALESPAGIFTEIPEGRFVGTHAVVMPPKSLARVAELEGSEESRQGALSGPALVESTLPLRVENEAGILAPVDLGLERSEGELQAKNPIVAVDLPTELGEGIGLAQGQIKIAFPDAAAATTPTIVDGSSAFYPNVGEETDLIIAPMPTGVETLTQLRTPQAPKSHVEKLSLPPGATLALSKSGGAEVARDGRVLMEVDPPTAVDAAGEPVPASLAVAGEELTVSVSPAPTAAYPILVDPNFRLDQYNWTWGGSSFHGWVGSQTAAGYRPLTYAYPTTTLPALDLVSGFSGGATVNTGAQWIYRVPRWDDDQVKYGDFPHSWIEYVSLGGMMFIKQGNNSYYPVLIAGIINPFAPGGAWISNWSYNGTQPEFTGWSGSVAFSDYGNPNGKIFSFGLITLLNEAQAIYRNTLAATAVVELRDEDTPQFSKLQSASGWWDTGEAEIVYSASDPGLGVTAFQVGLAGQGSPQTYSLGCDGTTAYPCPRVAASGTGGAPSLKVNAATAPEGTNSYTVTVLDPLYGFESGGSDPTPHKSSDTFQLKVDHSAPSLSLSGSVGEQAYKLAVEAKDPYSGVAQAKVYLDGALKETKTATCTSAGCPSAMAWTYSQNLAGLAEGNHTVEVIATDQLGHSKASQATFKLEAPDTVIDSGPDGLTNDTTPSFTYHSTLAGSTFSCAIDGGAYVSCPIGGYTAPGLSDGPHTFRVRSTSGAGIDDPSPATRSFTVDAAAPDTFIDAGPRPTTNDRLPYFGYRSSEEVSRFECRLDGGSFDSCPASGFEPDEPLSQGEHTFAVRAIDPAGNIDATPATQTFTVDSTPPTVTIETGPSGPTTIAQPTFTFSSGGATTLECGIDPETGGPEEFSFGPCTSSTTYVAPAPLPDGGYVFRVRASDNAGNRVTDDRDFRVDTVAPDTVIDSGPTGETDDAEPTFSYHSSEPGSSFKCRFDAEAFRACSGPGGADTPASALADGPHTFAVRATDVAGSTDPTPAARSFTVNTGGPQTTIDSGPSGAIGVTTATFKYSADEPATFQCSLDGAPFAACPAGEMTHSGLNEGEHSFEVRAVNTSAVVDPTPAQRSFVVDTSAPSAPTVTGAVRDPGVPGLTLRIEGSDGEASGPARRSGVEAFLVTVDGQLVETYEAPCNAALCPPTVVRNIQLPYPHVIGKHSYLVRSRDGLGNLSTAVSWEEETEEPGTLLRTLASASKSGPCAPDALTEAQLKNQLNVVPVERNKPVINGTNEADLIISRPGVKSIKGRGGCDVIVGNLSRETVNGGSGNDLILGARSNDVIRGGDGNDFIYGGIGDDHLYGGPGNDVIDGNPGADVERGEQDADTLRGGQGEDKLNGGGDEGDTVSYADALPIGFAESKQLVKKAQGKGIANFPQTTESGVYMELEAGQPKVYDGNTGAGGGTDTWIGKNNGGFKRIIGSPFSDWIEGTAGAKVIDPGPGPDAVFNAGSASVNSTSGDSVNGSPGEIGKRDTSKVHVGIQQHQGSDPETDLYLIGSDKADNVRVNIDRKKVQFIAKSPATKAALESLGGCGKKKGSTITCQVTPPLGAVVLYGGDQKDRIVIGREEAKTPGGIELNGGPGSDTLNGGPAGELLIDGIQQSDGGQEHIGGGAGDDALFQGEGSDEVNGGGDNDLLVSSEICRNDELRGDVKGKGDTGSDNAQFHPVRNVGVYANLEAGKIGQVGDKGGKNCPDGKQETLVQFNDLEGSPQPDYFRGTKDANLLIGRGGADQMFSLGKNDVINAKDKALDENINCDGDDDEAHVDTQKEKRTAENEGCENANFRGTTFPHRVILSADRESEPPLLGEVMASPAEPGPTAYFALDETAGTAAQNSVEESPNGTYKAVGVGPSVNGPGPTLGSDGGIAGEEEGTGVKLDGVDDFVDLAGQGLPAAGASGYATMLLVKFAGSASKREFILSGSDEGKGGEGIYLFRDPDGRIVFATGLGQGAPRVKTQAAFNDQGWHQVAASIAGETLTLNVDGFPYRLGLGESAMPKAAASPQSLLGAGPGPANLLAGNVDEVVFFEGPLSVEETIQGLGESSGDEPQFLLAPPAETADADGDGVTDGADNCPSVSNADQADANMDGLGDACAPPDGDGDGFDDASDNCPFDYNPEQTDSDSNGMGDECTELPPQVATGAATAVKGTTATVNGTVDPEGATTTYQFEYGTTTAYGSLAPVSPAAAGSGVDPVAASTALSGLQSDTTYHYRIVASNEFGETEGEDQTFTTMKLPAVTTGAATSVLTTSATLNGTVNPQGEATTYQFEYGKTTAYGSKAPASAKAAGSGSSAVAVNEAVTGLEPGTTYHFRLVATNGAGTATGADAVFTTGGGGMGAALAAMPVVEPFDGSAGSLANFAAQWTALGWASGSPAKGEDSTGGWRPVPAFPTVNGAYYSQTLTDGGQGVAAVATLAGSPTITERYFSLWLNMTAPPTAKSGYELRFTETSSGSYTVALSRWASGTATSLASKVSYAMPLNSKVAVVEKAGVVSAWVNSGSGFTQILSASDSTFTSGYTGLEGSGNILRLINFRSGELTPF